MADFIQGNKYPNSKKNMQFQKNRICVHSACTTILSQYNKYKYCHKHKPKTYPRIKGRQAPTDLQEPLQ
jgi:hypothetical protein